MADADSDLPSEAPPDRHQDNMIGDNVDEEGELGEEEDGFPLGPENNAGDEDGHGMIDAEASKSNTKGSSSSSKSQHKSGSERRRKHHHRHHHSSKTSGGDNSGSSSSRGDKRRRRSAMTSAGGAASPLGDSHKEPEDLGDPDERRALSDRLGGQHEDRGQTFGSSRRRSDSAGEKGGHYQPRSPTAARKLSVSNSHDRKGSRTSVEAELSADYGEGGGGGGGDARSSRRRDGRESRRRRERGEKSGSSRGRGGGDAGHEEEADEAEDGEILEDGELDDDDDGDDGGDAEEGAGVNDHSERNDKEGAPSKFSRRSVDKYGGYSPSERKRSSTDYRDKWKRDSDEKKRKRKPYGNPDEDDEDEARPARSSTSPPSGAGAPLAWGSGVSQVAPQSKASAHSAGGAASGGYRGKQHGGQAHSSAGGRYGRSGGHSPPGLYDSPSYSEDSEDGMADGYMDADDKEYENLRLKRAKKRGRDALGDGRKRGGPPRKKTLMEMAMSERPVCKFYMDGKCAKGSGCQFNHDVESPRPKMEVCKYHLTVKGCHKEHCLYMHDILLKL
ncbi:hypothetical protein EGW08_007883 [Elysia chlorotica]|uniref:C3H1-type domain-containing protein n=1 Tax=Elysia chlorotica TaxID=188477 RepID=A0A433TS41_ELYCH|nr:hypothetical protein EGW08_007883 [Elysia chlorotica]